MHWRQGVGPATCVCISIQNITFDALDIALSDIAAGRVHLFGLQRPHAIDPSGMSKSRGAHEIQRSFGVKFDDFRSRRTGRRPSACRSRRIGTACRGRARGRTAVASHDDAMISTRQAFRMQGARICDFPMAEEVREADAAGDWVVMGCPECSTQQMASQFGVCRKDGRSRHLRRASDYFYPAMLRAAIVLAGRGVLDLPGIDLDQSGRCGGACRSWCNRGRAACRRGAG